MTSLFDCAEMLQNNCLKEGIFLSHFELLDAAAMHILRGYSSLDEASEENLTRINPYGEGISPDVVFDAVNYIKNTPERESTRDRIKEFVSI